MTGFKPRALSEYGANMLKMGSGTVISGLIPIAGTLALMKLYSPSEFGALAVFISSYFILSVISTGRYETAIILPEKDDTARYLTIIPVVLSFSICLLATLLLIPFGNDFRSTFNIEHLGNWVFLIPITAFLFATIQSVFNYANRHKSYGLMARAKITNNAVQVGSQIAFGFAALPFNGLIVGRMLGRLAGLITYFKVIGGFFSSEFRFQGSEFKRVVKAYIHFPKHLSLSVGLSAIYQQIPILFVTDQFETSIAGYLAMAIQFVVVPNALVATAIGDVFRQKAAEEYREKGEFRQTLVGTIRKLFLYSIVPFAVLIIGAPYAFEWYDPGWTQAGVFASIMAVAYFFSFVITPIDKSLLVVERTDLMFLWNIGFFAGHVLITLPVLFLDWGIMEYLWSLVGLRVAATLAIAALSFRVSRGFSPKVN